MTLTVTLTLIPVDDRWAVMDGLKVVFPNEPVEKHGHVEKLKSGDRQGEGQYVVPGCWQKIHPKLVEYMEQFLRKALPDGKMSRKAFMAIPRDLFQRGIAPHMAVTTSMTGNVDNKDELEGGEKVTLTLP